MTESYTVKLICIFACSSQLLQQVKFSSVMSLYFTVIGNDYDELYIFVLFLLHGFADLRSLIDLRSN